MYSCIIIIVVIIIILIIIIIIYIRSCSSVLNVISMHAATKIVRDHSVFDALHRIKAIPSARRVTAASAVCSLIEIFNHNDISLKYIIHSNAI